MIHHAEGRNECESSECKRQINAERFLRYDLELYQAHDSVVIFTSFSVEVPRKSLSASLVSLEPRNKLMPEKFTGMNRVFENEFILAGKIGSLSNMQLSNDGQFNVRGVRSEFLISSSESSGSGGATSEDTLEQA